MIAEKILVVVNDEGEKRLLGYEGLDAELLWRLISGIAEVVDEYADRFDRSFPEPSIDVRRVVVASSEAVGWVDPDFPGTICLEKVEPRAVNAVQIDSIVPDECIPKKDQEPRSFRFRFLVVAEPMVDEKSLAKDLCGLPEKEKDR